jgi:NADPH:quinone reductase-like Zn-dependent oxidoreductase
MAGFKTTRRDALAAGVTMMVAGTSTRAEAKQGESTVAWSDRSINSYQIGEQKGLESLQRVSGPIPPPAAGEVLVEVRAAALNHRDLMIMRDQYGAPKPASRIPLGDGAGEVVAVGPGVTGFAAGDRVTAPHFTSWVDGEFHPSVFATDLGSSMDGWLTQVARLPAPALVKLPDGVSYEAAAAWGAAGITAWTVLETLGQIKAGDLVLALGTGGVSILALQLAKMNGASFAITSSSDAKLDVARELGADITVNYRTTPEWGKAVRAEAGRGVDIVVETVGMATLSESLSCCAPNARVGLLGALGGRPDGPTELTGLMLNNTVLKGITSGSRRMLADMLRAVDANNVEPKIDKAFGFDDAAAAYAYLNQGGHVGKIVVTMDPLTS